MATRTPTIDSQVHAYERNRPERPWSSFLQGPDEVTGDDMVAAMDAVGVDGALLISPFQCTATMLATPLKCTRNTPPVRPDPAVRPHVGQYRGRCGGVDINPGCGRSAG